MLKEVKHGLTLKMCLLLVVVLLAAVTQMREARAEFGDIVMNNFANESKEGPVVFTHWFHRIRYTCKVCHADLGIKFKAGATQMNMLQISDGKFCGACHNGDIAWSVDEGCELCHTGKKGMTAQSAQRVMNTLKLPETAATPQTDSKPKN